MAHERVSLQIHDNGRCPYLPNRRWVTESFRVAHLEPEIYAALLGRGWRRSGNDFYRNRCPGCAECIPIRVLVRDFIPSRSQRRVLRRNADLTLEIHLPEADPAVFDLYRRYQRARFRPDSDATFIQFTRFLAESPVSTRMMLYRDHSEIVAAGWIDELPDGLSTVYCIYDPDENRRSLGTYTALREIELSRSRGVSYYYLGFYVQNSPRMSYKSRFRPYQILRNGRWVEPGQEESLGPGDTVNLLTPPDR